MVTFTQPPQFKLDPRLARLLGLHTQSRSAIVQALWQYVKTNRLQDSHDKEYINGDKYFQQVVLTQGRGEQAELPVGEEPLLRYHHPYLLDSQVSEMIHSHGFRVKRPGS